MKITLIIFPGLKRLAEKQLPEDCFERQQSDRWYGSARRSNPFPVRSEALACHLPADCSGAQ